MCDTNWRDRAKELESFEKSWKAFEEFVQWIRGRWPGHRTPEPEAEAPGKPQAAGG